MLQMKLYHNINQQKIHFLFCYTFSMKSISREIWGYIFFKFPCKQIFKILCHSFYHGFTVLLSWKITPWHVTLDAREFPQPYNKLVNRHKKL